MTAETLPLWTQDTTDAPGSYGDEPALGGDVRKSVERAGGEGVTPSAGARWSDPATSHDTARTVNVVKSTAYVLALLHELEPCTAEDLERAAAARGAQWRPSRIRSALADLVRLERAVRVLPNGVTSTGRPARRWRSA